MTALRLAAAALAAGLSASASAQPHVVPQERRSPIVAAVEKVGASVVNISAEHLVRRRSSIFEDFFNFGGDRRGSRTESLGSGVITDTSGIVVTNDHVVSGASKIYVTTSDGKEYEAEVLGADSDNDLAVLKVEAKGLRAVKLGTTSDLLIGETVIAIGNPFGLSNTVTAGIVSAVHRSVQGESRRTYSDFIQTDAAINPGNSGGALVNVLGELIGINTAIVGGANTIGFAIPIDRVKRITNDLLRFGQVKAGWIGLRGSTESADEQRWTARGLGLRVKTVYPKSPAAQAGIQPGDVIVAFDGRPIESREDYETELVNAGQGKTVTLKARRKGQEKTFTLTTEHLPQDLGLEVLRRDVGLALSQGRSAPVVSSVTPNSAADQTGLERGDQILAANGQKVKTLDELSRAVETGFSRSGLVLVVVRGGIAYTLSFPLE
jgi:serine protease Do